MLSDLLGSPGYISNVCKCIITRLLSSTSVLKTEAYDCYDILLMVQKSCTTEKSPKLIMFSILVSCVTGVFLTGFLNHQQVCHMSNVFMSCLYVYSLVHRDPGNS